MVNPHCSIFRMITAIFSGVRIFRNFTVFLTVFVFHRSGEYGNVFRRQPTDPLLSLCIALDFVHIASQRFAAKRQNVVTQVICLQMGLVMRKPVFGVYDRDRLKLVCSAKEAS